MKRAPRYAVVDNQTIQRTPLYHNRPGNTPDVELSRLFIAFWSRLPSARMSRLQIQTFGTVIVHRTEQNLHLHELEPRQSDAIGEVAQRSKQLRKRGRSG